MKTFLVVMLILSAVGLLVRSRHLAGIYPRAISVHRSEDVIGLVIQIGMLAWVIILLDVF